MLSKLLLGTWNLRYDFFADDAAAVSFAVAVLKETHRLGGALQVWDLGGQANLRPSWQTYYKATDAVIMVVDSTDRARVGIAKVSSTFSLVCLLLPVFWQQCI